VTLRVSTTLYLRADALAGVVRPRVIKALRAWFHPLNGGPDGKGWPFGRDIHVSEVYQSLERVPGVDYVEEVDLEPLDPPDETRVERDEAGKPIRVTLRPHELVALELDDEDFTVIEAGLNQT
jgi:hypothetical protein